jgi:hypothetical protein
MGFFPHGPDSTTFFSVRLLEFCRSVTLNGKVSTFALALSLKGIHALDQSLYAKLLPASRYYRKLLFYLETLGPFQMESTMKGCPACGDRAFVAMDGCFRLCRRKAAGNQRTAPMISHFFVEPAGQQHSSQKDDQTEIECSQFRNTEQGRTRSRFKTLDETGMTLMLQHT